jgi:hypothetical protein
MKKTFSDLRVIAPVYYNENLNDDTEEYYNEEGGIQYQYPIKPAPNKKPMQQITKIDCIKDQLKDTQNQYLEL